MKQFLDEDGLKYLVEQLITIINQKSQVNIISDIDENSTNQQVPGAKAVYDFLTDALAGIQRLTKEVVQQRPNTGEDNVIYLVPVDNDTFQQWMYINNSWFDFGTTEIDLSGYWKKNDLAALTNTEIQTIIDAAGI